MEQILKVYSLPKETVTEIIMLYKNMKAMVHSPGFFDIITRIYHGNLLESYVFIICQDYVNRSNKRK